MSVSDAQKSEVHYTTADASTSPTAEGDAVATRQSARPRDPWNDAKINPEPPVRTNIVRDDTDQGGPLVIESDDPDLNPPRLPENPFPTDRTPEIDPPVSSQNG